MLARGLHATRAVRTFVPVLLALAGGCGFHSQGGAADQLPPDGEVGDSCTTIDDAAAVTIATAARADEHALRLTGRAMSATSWATAGNEALVLEVSGAGGRLIGHLVLHQGADEATYGMHVGALAVGEPIAVRVSTDRKSVV